MVAFVLHERRIEHPMLNLDLFRIHNFAIGNLQTLSMYAGPVAAVLLPGDLPPGTARATARWPRAPRRCPVTLVMFALSSRFGALADRHGPRFFMGVGPLVAAAGLALMTTVDADVQLLHRPAAAAAGVLAGPVDDGRPADRHGAGGRRRGQRGHGQRDQQRHRPHRRGCWASRWSVRWWPGRYGEQARHVRGRVPPGDGHLGGPGGAGRGGRPDRHPATPTREVQAEGCPGGQLAGHAARGGSGQRGRGRPLGTRSPRSPPRSRRQRRGGVLVAAPAARSAGLVASGRGRLVSHHRVRRRGRGAARRRGGRIAPLAQARRGQQRGAGQRQHVLAERAGRTGA